MFFQSKIQNLKSKIKIVCSGFAPLDYDFAGNEIQDWADLSKELDSITLTLIPTNTGSAAVFAWHGRHDNGCLQLIRSFVTLPKAELSNKIADFIINSFENFYFSPVWWEGLSSEEQKHIFEVFIDSPEFLSPRNPRYLLENHITGLNWEFEKITSNIILKFKVKSQNFGECRREYIGLERSTLSRSIKIYGAELSAILSPNFKNELAFNRQVNNLVAPFVFQAAFGD